MSHISGLIAATFTPMHEDGSINLDMIEKQSESLIANDVSGAFVCGTTGESLSLTLEERMKIAERWQQVAGEELIIIVHVGHNCLPYSQKLAAHAQRIGAHAVASMAPCFFRPTNIEELVAICREIAAAAPELPFYYYHIPSMTKVEYPMVDFLRAAKDKIPTLAGVKFTFEDLMDFEQCLRMDNGRFNMLFGRDEILLAGLSLGATGAIGSTYNYAAPLYHRIIEAYKTGDMTTARKEQARSQAMVKNLHKFGGLPTSKAIMKMIGLDCGDVRLPLQNLTKKQYERVYANLENIDFFSVCSSAST